MKHLVLVEEAPTDFSTGSADDVVALTPSASYGLDKRGVAYRIPADFGTEEGLQEVEDGFWEDELAWLDQVDAMLQERRAELSARAIRPAVLYGYHLKTLLDNLFIRGFEIMTLLTRGYGRVVLWPGRSGLPATDFLRSSLEQSAVYARVLKHVCACRGIEYEELGSPDLAREGKGHLRFYLSSLKAGLRRRQWALEALFRGVRPPQRRLGLLFLEEGPYLGDLLGQAVRAGHRCLVLRGDRVIDLSRGGRCLWRLEKKGRIDGARVEPWYAVAEELFSPESPIWKWPDGWFGCSMSPLLAGVLKMWVTQEVAGLIDWSDAFYRFYRKEGIDFVLTPFLTQKLHFPAVAACYRPDSAQSVLVADGDGPDAAKAWDLTELFRAQHYFVPDHEFADYFRQRRSLYPTRLTARIHVESGRWRSYTRLAQKPHVYLQRWEGRPSVRFNRPPLRVPNDRPIVVYVVARMEMDARLLNYSMFPETWYYRLQTSILRVFASLPEYTFVIKLFPTPNTACTTIEQTVADLGAKNLFISRSPFRRWLPWADRVILDTPSTPLYEAALAGVPFHQLVYRRLAMRSAALAKFADWLTCFDEPEEAAAAVQNYLRFPHRGKPFLQPEGEDFTTTLAALALNGSTGDHGGRSAAQ